MQIKFEVLLTYSFCLNTMVSYLLRIVYHSLGNTAFDRTHIVSLALELGKELQDAKQSIAFDQRTEKL